MFQIQDYDDLFLYVYCFIDDGLKEIGYQIKNRCELNASEILTIQVVGEIMQKRTEIAIYRLLREYRRLFTAVIPRSSFYKQLKQHLPGLDKVMTLFGTKFGEEDRVCFADGFPLPIKKFARAQRGCNLNGRAKIGYCASLKEHFYGLKGHLLIVSNGTPRRLLFAPGSVHDCKLLPDLIDQERGKIIGGDKGYIGQKIQDAAANNNNTVITQKRKNQTDARDHNKAIRPLMKKRKIVETVIGHLERMNSKVMKQRSFWMIQIRMIAKCVAISAAIAFNTAYCFDSLLSMDFFQPEFL